MAKVFRTLRNNWKKSVFFSGVAVYGANFAHNKYEENQLMRAYCQEARLYGDAAIGSASTRSYHVTVILNPAASKGKARTRFESYCAPLLHLAGMKVSVIRTEAEGQAKEIMEAMSDTDAVLIAGGDGTVMETVTGLMRRKDVDQMSKTMPIGILPVGQTNRMAKNLFPSQAELGEVSLMADAAMSVVRQLLRPLGVIQVKNIGDDEMVKGKSLYGLRQVQVGAFADAHERVDKYWYWAALKHYVSYIFAYSSAASKIMWSCASKVECGVPERNQEAVIENPPPQARSWWSYVMPSYGSTRQTETKPQEEANLEWTTIAAEYKGPEMTMESANNHPLTVEQEETRLKLYMAPDEVEFQDFIQEGWKRERNSQHQTPAEWQKEEDCSAIRWYPDESIQGKETEEKYFFLDNEGVEIKGALEVSVIPDKMVVFCSKENQRAWNKEKDTHDKKWWQRNVNRISTMPHNKP